MFPQQPTLRRTATSPVLQTHAVELCDQREVRHHWLRQPLGITIETWSRVYVLTGKISHRQADFTFVLLNPVQVHRLIDEHQAGKCIGGDPLQVDLLVGHTEVLAGQVLVNHPQVGVLEPQWVFWTMMCAGPVKPVAQSGEVT